MQRLTLLFLAAALLLGSALSAQAATPLHGVDLTWSDTNTTASTDTYNVYVATGTCSAAGVPLVPNVAPFARVNTAPITAVGTTAAPYVDNAVNQAGGTTYCFYVTAVSASGSESAPSATSQATIPALFPPTNVTATPF
jgi:hypothetical protein